MAIILMIAIFFIIDRFLKIIASRSFSEDHALPLLGDFLSFSFAKNYAIAFSLPVNGPWLLVVTGLIILIIAVIAAEKIWHVRRLETEAIFLLLILAGAISNFIDRWLLGYVIDYFSLKNLAIFNLADVMISLGAGILIWLIWRHHEKSNKSSSLAQSSRN